MNLVKTIKIVDERPLQPSEVERTFRNMGWLVSLAGPGLAAGIIFALPDHTIIGSGSASQLHLPHDATVSEMHASIRLSEDNVFYLQDLAATNPVLLNAMPLKDGERHPLIDGDEIVVGCTHLCFKDIR